MEQEGDHRARIFSGSEPTDQPLVHRTEFWRRTGYAPTLAASVPPGRPKSVTIGRMEFLTGTPPMRDGRGRRTEQIATPTPQKWLRGERVRSNPNCSSRCGQSRA